MAERVLRRPIVLIAALLVASAALVAISVSESRAGSHLLPADDTIVFEFGTSGNKIVYGSTEQPLLPLSSNCKLTPASTEGPIMTIAATSVDKKGNPVDPSPVGLVDFGMGTSEKGVGNGQDCALIDQGEALVLTLTDQVGQLIHSWDVDFEGKFGGTALITYLLGGFAIGSEVLEFNELSDNGPDARDGDNNYFQGLPDDVTLQGIVFDGVMIEPNPDPASDPGSVSLQSGMDFPIPADNRTTFHLIPALDCGDSLETGGPFQDDDPLANFFLGPTKGGEPCAVPVELTTTTEQGEGGTEQIVSLVPPEGFSWEGIGVTGLLTVVWDVEVPDGNPIDRTYARVGEVDTVIPWCEDVIGYSPSGDGWSYDLDPEVRYPEATDGDLCLVDQSTATVFYDHDEDPLTDDIVMTQTTEIFYIWNDPDLVRF